MYMNGIPVCAKCGKIMSVKKNGQDVVINTEDSLGNEYPYEVHIGDLWACKECGCEVVVGFGGQPIVRHDDVGFEDEAFKPDSIQVR
jgi:hypothetical protein